MSVPFNPESDQGMRVLDAVTDPRIDDQLGFSLIDTNPGFSDEDTVIVLDDEISDKRPVVDQELEPALATARELYLDTFGASPALRGAEARWVDAYSDRTGTPLHSGSIFECMAADGFQTFFGSTLDSLEIPVGDKIMIAHTAALLDHPGKDMAQPSGRALFEAAAGYLERKQDLIPESIVDYPGEFDDQASFGRYVVEQVTRNLADDAMTDLEDMGDPAKAEELKARQQMLTEAFELNLDEYLKTVMLDWEILPPDTEEHLHGLITEAEENGWKFDRERYLFLRRLQHAGNGTMYRSGSFRTDRGYYLAVVFEDSESGYAVVADNPINVDKQDHAVYVAVQDKIARSPRTGKAFTWPQVMSEDKRTARALGAIKRKHTTNYKRNVIDTLPGDLRTRVSSVVT